MAPVVDAREHDQRAGGGMHGEGGGQEERHGAHRTDAGQHAHDGSHDHADEARERGWRASIAIENP